jgi:hypothetical protein
MVSAELHGRRASNLTAVDGVASRSSLKQGITSHLAETLAFAMEKCQGTTLVVPQSTQNEPGL